MTFAIVVGMIAVALFPMWPFELKYTMWLISLYSAIVIVSVMAIRLLVYLVGAVFGGSLWIFPRLM
jgi:Translocation protein Sec62